MYISIWKDKKTKIYYTRKKKSCSSREVQASELSEETFCDETDYAPSKIQEKTVFQI